MKLFKEYHPLVISVYFISVILSTMIQLHPVFLVISTVSALVYCYDLKFLNRKYLVGIILFYLIIAISNPIFVHSGTTILFYINYTPVTLESVIYGFVFAAVIISILNWFKLLNICLDSEKIIYLFNKNLPTIGLMISMILGMIPKLIKQAKRVKETQKTLGNDISRGNLISRLKIGFDILLILFTWGFESSLITLKSMQSRGYGKKIRTYYHTYEFESRDQIVCIIIVLLDLMFIFGYITRFSSFYYYPIMKSITFEVLDILYYLGYILLLSVPFLLEKGGNKYVDI